MKILTNSIINLINNLPLEFHPFSYFYVGIRLLRLNVKSITLLAHTSLIGLLTYHYYRVHKREI